MYHPARTEKKTRLSVTPLKTNVKTWSKLPVRRCLLIVALRPNAILNSDSIRKFSCTNLDAELTEEEMIIINASSDSKVDDKTIQRSTLMLRLKDGIGSLARILKTIEVRRKSRHSLRGRLLNSFPPFISVLHLQNFKGTVVHVESRPSNVPGVQYDALVKIDLTRQSLLLLIRSLRQSSALGGVSLLTDNNISIKGELNG